MKVLLVDDHHLFRQALRGMLKEDPRVEMVGEAGDAAEAMRHLEHNSVDVVLLDLNLPDIDGIEVVRSIRPRWPKLPILMLSMHDGGKEVLAAIAEGANGYLTKTVEPEELRHALATVVKGGTHLSSSVAPFVLERVRKGNQMRRLPSLTERESDILNLIVSGKNNSEISEELSLSVSRIKFHLSDLFQRFEVSDRTSLAVEATKRGVQPRF